MIQDFYTFVVTLIKEEKGYSAYFSDLQGCYSIGDNLEEVILNAKESLGLHLYSMEIDKIEIPNPTSIENIKLENNEFTGVITVYMPVIRNEMNQKSVKKTVTLPSWLNDIAMKNNINFSQVLQTAIKRELGIKEF